jgi:hypothetical protein
MNIKQTHNLHQTIREKIDYIIFTNCQNIMNEKKTTNTKMS